MVRSSAPRAVADAGIRLPSRPRGARMGGVAPRDSAATGRAMLRAARLATGARRTPTKIMVLRRFCGLAGFRAAL